MENKYVKCSCCGKRIYFGEEVYRYKGYCGVYCSADCFADCFCVVNELNTELADNCCCEVFDDDARKRELKDQMENLLKQMNDCKEEYETLCNSTR
jgi:hypothetical protein